MGRKKVNVGEGKKLYTIVVLDQNRVTVNFYHGVYLTANNDEIEAEVIEFMYSKGHNESECSFIYEVIDSIGVFEEYV